MPRVARIVIPNCPHHVTQRGNNRQDVFLADEDRVAYLELLQEEAQRQALGVEGYCLMSNHVHLIVTPKSEAALAKALGRTGYRYAQYINRRHGRSGHLWQNRFDSCALDADHYWTAMAYVEQNPVRARIVRCAWRYAWSSAAAHCGVEPDRSGLLELSAWGKSMTDSGWRQTLGQRLDGETFSRLRLSTHRGRPLGSDRFLRKIESLLGRRLRPLPLSRRRKKSKNSVTVSHCPTPVLAMSPLRHNNPRYVEQPIPTSHSKLQLERQCGKFTYTRLAQPNASKTTPGTAEPCEFSPAEPVV
jgi:putative transposase